MPCRTYTPIDKAPEEENVAQEESQVPLGSKKVPRLGTAAKEEARELLRAARTTLKRVHDVRVAQIARR